MACSFSFNNAIDTQLRFEGRIADVSVIEAN